MNNCDVLNAFSSLEPKLLDSVSLAAQLASAVKRSSSTISLSITLWRNNRALRSMLGNVDDILSGRKVATPAKETITPQKMEELVRNIEYLHRTLEYMYEGARRARLMNNSRLAGALIEMKGHSDRLLDLANWVECCVDPKCIDDFFALSKKEADSGEVYELSQLQ